MTKITDHTVSGRDLFADDFVVSGDERSSGLLESRFSATYTHNMNISMIYQTVYSLQNIKVYMGIYKRAYDPP